MVSASWCRHRPYSFIIASKIVTLRIIRLYIQECNSFVIFMNLQEMGIFLSSYTVESGA